jgi:hypothetical protein
MVTRDRWGNSAPAGVPELGVTLQDAGLVIQSASLPVFHFSTWVKARAMQRWIDRSAVPGTAATVS